MSAVPVKKTAQQRGRHARTKGGSGEREACKLFNGIIERVVTQELHGTIADIEQSKKMVQRNQNQSAVGGKDLSNTMGLSVEVKRCETLQIKKWWKQCVIEAQRNGEHPVLMYRQSRQPWRFMTTVTLETHPNEMISELYPVVATIEEDDFKLWLTEWVRNYFRAGGKIIS